MNLDAETTFEGMIALSNQGSETVQLGGVSQELGDEIELWFEPQTEPQASLGDDHFEGTVADSNIADGELANPHYQLAPGETTVYDLIVPTEETPSSLSEEVTLSVTSFD
ncbi:hypothetical protein [Natrialba sp. SSL1]|uniref:hypothetical protein n=1 Tax=Natrialba sp. SSL1 TaxID=1869245 RepID=UPI0008F800E0|nr:hypothetical protein [Natrialba sp. SSL1]OIB58949.1 hypothetical protein BBD46_05435 [Natrialba sp. SSL1]